MTLLARTDSSSLTPFPCFQELFHGLPPNVDAAGRRVPFSDPQPNSLRYTFGFPQVESILL